MTEQTELIEQFITKAELVSATVKDVADETEALQYVIDLCEKKEACQLLTSGCEHDLSDKAEALCDGKQQKVIAAPGLAAETFQTLATLSEKSGFACIDAGLRDHLAGIDIGFTVADLGIAETGTLVLDCPDEDLRLSTMVSEIHVCLLKKSDILADSEAAEPFLLERMKNTPDYLAFITGASRTADIERVLALGVHGPLELHILLLEG